MRTTLFISHGGGPLPLLGDKNHDEMLSVLNTIREKIVKPAAIAVISAHWEENTVSVTSGESPSLIYDYSGFPPESYALTYPAPGDPELAGLVKEALEREGISVHLNDQRGFDHGMFVPLSILFPEAEIPVVQISLARSLDPKLHIEIGKALAGLPVENLLIIGSGFTFHNLRSFFAQKTESVQNSNRNFENWLETVLTDQDLSEDERENLLIHWEDEPGARFCHPREEHLIPLHLCYGAEQRAASEYYRIKIMGIESGYFLWQPPV